MRSCLIESSDKKEFPSVEKAQEYLRKNFNGHGRIEDSVTGHVYRQCRCPKSSGCHVVYVFDPTGKTKVNEGNECDQFDFTDRLMDDREAYDDFKENVAGVKFDGFAGGGVDRWEAKSTWKSETGWTITARACTGRNVRWHVEPPVLQYSRKGEKKFSNGLVDYRFDTTDYSHGTNEFSGMSKTKDFKNDVSKILSDHSDEIFPSSMEPITDLESLRKEMVKEKLNIDPDAELYYGEMVRTASSKAMKEFLVRHGVEMRNFPTKDRQFYVYCNSADSQNTPYFLFRKNRGCLEYKVSSTSN